MFKALIVSLFIVVGLSAREYNDPAKKKKNGLLEVGQTPPAQVVEAAPAPAAAPVGDAGKIQYCGCVNLNKLISKKREMTNKLISNDVIDDGDWSIRNELRKNENDTEAAVKKAAYKHSIDRSEVECDIIKLSYKKVSDMKEDIQAAGLACNLVDI